MILPFIGLLAVTVYQYDFHDKWIDETGLADPPTGTIEFYEPCGQGGLESVYSLSIKSFRSETTDAWGNPLPLIPATTFTLNDLSTFRGSFSWDEDFLRGSWGMTFNRVEDLGLFVRAGDYNIDSFYPLIYWMNEASASGSWTFTGKRNIPEAGGTLLYMALGMIALIWRKK